MIYVVGEKQGMGGTRRHLAQMLGTTVEEMTESVIWVNLWEYEHQTDAAASKMAHWVEESVRPGDAILMLGRRVADAFSLSDIRPLDIVDRGDGAGPLIAAVPHPSGLNRWYNDPENVAQASAMLRAIWGTHR